DVEALLRQELSIIEEKKNLPKDLPLIFADSFSMFYSPYSNGPVQSALALAHGNRHKKVNELIEKLNGPVLPLRLQFSILRVKRDDPAEALLVNMLLNSEP